jgi:hypothetical protein
MKTTIVAAVVALSLGVGSAFAQGVPAGYQPPVYASQSDHSDQAVSQFLGPKTVLGKALNYNSNGSQVPATPSSKG